MKYHVNKNAQPTGEHEVHSEVCTRCPDTANRIALGEHATCRTAVTKAKEHFTRVDGCFYCSRDCHTG